MTPLVAYPPPPPIRASDADRDAALELLRAHWLAGRLTLEEYEERCGEAAGARYLGDLGRAARELPAVARASAPAPPSRPQPGTGTAVSSLVLGIVGLAGLMVSFGLLFLLTLPTSVTAWSLGRRARRAPGAKQRSLAATGETLGIVGTMLGCLALTACGLIVSGW